MSTHQAPPLGLYRQFLSQGLEQQLRQPQETLVATVGLDPQEARSLPALVRIALVC